MKKFFLMLIILFFCGIVSADVCIDIIKDSSVLLNMEIYKGYASAELVYQDVFWNVLYERIKMFGFLFLLCFTPIRRYLSTITASVFSFIWGFFLMSCIIELGLVGVVVGIGAVIPHGLLYGALILMMLQQREIYTYHHKNNVAFNIVNIVLMILLFITGCVIESLVSTHFIPWVIRLSLI